MLEELGIEPDKICKRLKCVLLPTDIPEECAVYDDMAGPLFLFVLFAFSFLLRGRVEFGNIYGFGLTGSCWIWFMINLMA